MKDITIAIIAGEASGDKLGANVMKSILKVHPNTNFIGIGGINMTSLGFKSFFKIERLSVMGIFSVIKRLPELLIRRFLLIYQLKKAKPNIVIGIDSPDFNLYLERKMKNSGFMTIHFVSPSVWAWRENRVYDVAKSCHLLFSILPFERKFYKQRIPYFPVIFVGHPKAKEIPMHIKHHKKDHKTIALLPGSRNDEIHHLSNIFIETAVTLNKNNPNLKFIMSAANDDIFEKLKIYENNFIEVSKDFDFILKNCDFGLVASGTAVLEACLHKMPLVVVYKTSPRTFHLIKSKLKIPFVSLPNIILNRWVVKEILQEDVTLDNLVTSIKDLMDDKNIQLQQINDFHIIHQMLINSNISAGDSILKILK